MRDHLATIQPTQQDGMIVAPPISLVANHLQPYCHYTMRVACEQEGGAFEQFSTFGSVVLAGRELAARAYSERLVLILAL